jgi:predicted lipoprotein with Yx(FWY)xxD motif
LTNGVLTTNPIDIHLPFYGNRVSTEMYIRDMRLKLELDPDGAAASGLLTGYHDLENWWDYVRKMGYLIDTAQFSCPAMYRAATELADGYPDPKTGKCTALSVAYKINLVSGFVVRTGQKPSEGVSVPLPKASEGTNAVDSVGALNALSNVQPPGFSAQVTPLGTVLANIQGRTLYSAPPEETLEFVGCDSLCLRDWQPELAPWLSKAVGEWSLVSRKNGSLQWEFRDQALYTCKRDSKPNIATCEGNGWHAVVATAAPTLPTWVGLQNTSLGSIYTDQRGHTLYTLVGDRKEFEREICDQACIDSLWIPVEAASDAQDVGEWQPVAQGTKRWWYYRGLPIYTYARDKMAGQFLGHLFGGASVSAKNYWTALPPEIADMSSPRQSRP